MVFLSKTKQYYKHIYTTFFFNTYAYIYFMVDVSLKFQRCIKFVGMNKQKKIP